MDPFNVVSTDITNLESAWSAVVPSYYRNFTEKRAPEAFKECIQKFVYYRKLLFPVPWDEIGIANPLMKLWCDNRDTNEWLNDEPIVKGAMAIEIAREEEIALLDVFQKDICKDPWYHYWLQFQLSDVVTDGYVSRLSTRSRNPVNPILESRNILDKLISAGYFNDIRESLSSIKLSYWHLEQCKKLFKSDVFVYVLSYAYSMCRRGRKYGKALCSKAYTSHWSRFCIQCLPQIDKFDESNIIPFSDFTDWGEVVYSLIQEGFVRHEENAIVSVLQSIRDSVQSGNFDLHRDSVKDQVRILARAGIEGKWIEKPWFVRISALPGDFVNKLPCVGKVLSPVFSIITYFGNSRWLEKIDAKLTRTAIWNVYKKTFYLPGVVCRESKAEFNEKHDN